MPVSGGGKVKIKDNRTSLHPAPPHLCGDEPFLVARHQFLAQPQRVAPPNRVWPLSTYALGRHAPLFYHTSIHASEELTVDLRVHFFHNPLFYGANRFFYE